MNSSISMDEQEQINRAIEYLQAHGYMVVLPGEWLVWETPSQLCERLGCSVTHFCRCRRRSGCPAFRMDCGPHGRIRKLRSNEALESFLRCKAKGGRPVSMRLEMAA